jgi:hypothetical protein
MRIDLVDAGGLGVMKCLGDGIAVVAGLFETSGKCARVGDFREPCDQGFDAFCGIVETVGEHLIGGDEVTEEVGFTDIDTQKKGWMIGGLRCNIHCLVQMPERVLKTTHGGKVTVSSKQIRMI